MRSYSSIVGGMFGLEADRLCCDARQLSFAGDHMMMFNERCCIYYLINQLTCDRVWMPSYLCHTMIDAALAAEANVQFYPIDERLQISDISWIEKVQASDLVLFIDYYGFPPRRSVLQQIKATGAIIVEDAAHAMLSKFERTCSDFVLFSPRKLCGVPAGAVLMALNEQMAFPSLPPAPLRAVNAAYRAFLMRTAFDYGNGSDNDWFLAYRQAEMLQPIGDYAIDELSSSLLQTSVDYELIADKRRSNFNYLLNQLKDIGIYKQLPDDVVPLGFPVLLNKRDIVQRMLFEKSIFCPIHWPIEGIVPQAFDQSHKLSRCILSLVCDQRCTCDQLQQIVDTIKGVGMASAVMQQDYDSYVASK